MIRKPPETEVLPSTNKHSDLFHFDPQTQTQEEFYQRFREVGTPVQVLLWDIAWEMTEIVVIGSIWLQLQKNNYQVATKSAAWRIFEPSTDEELKRNELRLRAAMRIKVVGLLNLAHAKTQQLIKVSQPGLVNGNQTAALKTEHSIAALQHLAKLFDPTTGAFSLDKLVEEGNRLPYVLSLVGLPRDTLVQIVAAYQIGVTSAETSR